MSKLFKLKKWLTIGDAAEYLGMMLGEKVTEADVLRFGLEGDLQLSIHLVNGGFARPCISVNVDDVEWNEVTMPDGKATLKIPKNGRIWQDVNGVYQVQKIITELEYGIFDLPLTGGERIDVEHLYQFFTGGPERTAVSLDGVLVATQDGQLFEIQTLNEYKVRDPLAATFLDLDRFHPAGALPDDAVFVVRTAVLTRFVESLSDEEKNEEKPLETKERNTLLCIIGALCKEAQIPFLNHSKAARLIQSTAQKMGVSIGETTIEGHLKKIPDALASRMK